MIFSILAFLTLFLSICIKNRKTSLRVQAINCLFESMYAFYIHAFTGAILGIINFIRSSLFAQKEKFNKKVYFCLFLIFESIIIINCIYTWNGYISLLPTIGSTIRTYCLWQTNMKYVRLSGITSGILFGLYYYYYNSLFIVLGYVILLLVSWLAFYKNDLYHEPNNNNNNIKVQI